MIKSFKERKPWAAAIIALLLGPTIGMFYLNRGRLGLAYLAFTIILAISPFTIAHLGILNVHPVDIVNLVLTVLQIIGTAHCFLIARQNDYAISFKWYSRWYVLVSFIAILLCLAFLFRTFFYEPFNSPASSMSPNVNKDDYFFAKKFAYMGNSPERGDVVIFKVNNVSFIKRIVGIPGDRIQIKDSLLYINDIAAPRKQIDDYALQYETIHQYIETLPDGREYKILDDYSHSPLDNTPPYIVPEHHYFVLGDNRDQSQDSRIQTFGFIPEENITGKAALIIWNDWKNRLEFRIIN